MLQFADILKWITIICFGYFILRNLKHWVLWIIGQLVLWGWWFPKTMREVHDANVLKLHKTSKETDELIEKIENAQNKLEVEILHQRIKKINA